MTSVRAFVAAPAARRAARDAFSGPDARWNLLLLCVAVYVLAAVGRLHQLWPSLSVARPTFLSAGLALVCIALDSAAMARLRGALRLPTVRWLVALVVWATLSIPLALWPGGAFDIVVNGMYKSLAMLIVVITAVRGPRDLTRLVAILFIATATFASFVYVQFDVEPVTARFRSLVFYDPNEFAVLAVATFPFGAFALWRANSPVVRVAIATLMTMMFMVFAGCGSRGAFLALGVAAMFALLRLSVLKMRWRVLGFVGLTVAFVATASDSFWQRMDSVVETETDYNLTSPTGRLQVWKRGVGYMMDRPIFGVGAGNFPTAEGTISDYARSQYQSARGVKWSVSHNSYVQVGAELGVPGLVFFGAALVTAMLGLNRVARTARQGGPDTELRALAQAALIALVGFAAGATFLSLAYSDVVFMLLALSLSIYSVALRTRALPPWHGSRHA